MAVAGTQHRTDRAASKKSDILAGFVFNPHLVLVCWPRGFRLPGIHAGDRRGYGNLDTH